MEWVRLHQGHEGGGQMMLVTDTTRMTGRTMDLVQRAMQLYSQRTPGVPMRAVKINNSLHPALEIQ